MMNSSMEQTPSITKFVHPLEAGGRQAHTYLGRYLRTQGLDGTYLDNEVLVLRMQ